jgi:hypothetical protein
MISEKLFQKHYQKERLNVDICTKDIQTEERRIGYVCICSISFTCGKCAANPASPYTYRKWLLLIPCLSVSRMNNDI